MKKMPLVFCALFIFFASASWAVTTLDDHNLVLASGENITLSLNEYSYVNIRTHEGNVITLNVGRSIR